jgi:hypothetical protein
MLCLILIRVIPDNPWSALAFPSKAKGPAFR